MAVDCWLPWRAWEFEALELKAGVWVVWRRSSAIFYGSLKSRTALVPVRDFNILKNGEWQKRKKDTDRNDASLPLPGPKKRDCFPSRKVRRSRGRRQPPST